LDKNLVITIVGVVIAAIGLVVLYS